MEDSDEEEESPRESIRFCVWLPGSFTSFSFGVIAGICLFVSARGRVCLVVGGGMRESSRAFVSDEGSSG